MKDIKSRTYLLIMLLRKRVESKTDAQLEAITLRNDIHIELEKMVKSLKEAEEIVAGYEKQTEEYYQMLQYFEEVYRHQSSTPDSEQSRLNQWLELHK